MKIVLLDDHPMVLAGLQILLKEWPSFQITKTFISAKELLSKLPEISCDVLIIDVNLQDMFGWEVCQVVKEQFPDIRILGLSNSSEISIVKQMVQMGASGFVLKNVSSEELKEAIEYTAQGKHYFSREIQNLLLQSKEEEVPVLTRREREVLILVADGEKTQSIAEKLFISPLTVETHRRNLLQKLAVSNTASLIRKATNLRLI